MNDHDTPDPQPVAIVAGDGRLTLVAAQRQARMLGRLGVRARAFLDPVAAARWEREEAELQRADAGWRRHRS